MFAHWNKEFTNIASLPVLNQWLGVVDAVDSDTKKILSLLSRSVR